MKRPNRFFVLIFPWVLVVVAFFIFYQPPFVIWPSGIRKGFYSDSVTRDKGNSGIKQLKESNDTLTFQYVLGDKFEFPYVGATFELEKDSVRRFSDLSAYDYVRITLDAQYSKRIPVVINQDIKKYSNPEVGVSYRPLTKELIYEDNKRDYDLKLSDFQTPSWWFTITSLTEKEVGKPDFSRAHSVQVHNCQVLPKGKAETFTIYRIEFYKDMGSFRIWALAALCFYYLGLMLTTRYRGTIKKIFPRKELPLGNMADEDSKKVSAYIAENYNKPDLSMEMLQKELGMSESKISQVIKTVSDMNFKKYLNTVRLEEAKRLLLQTDRPVMDIAYKVGYGNVTHFNRVFKETEGCSPNEFRKVSSEKA